ncbi:lipase [Armillaria luteobubalina]|uniref:Lipase n=1 Tax=Armillaria luteobubalina TaxID=153913 RepID=A0AA39QF26_9AGAR|nr:lipase [Armillaria luteobubalina]
MVPSLTCWVALALVASLVSASPLQLSVLERRQSVTTLTSAQVSAFHPYTSYASAGYCQPSTTLTWTCGAPCQANPGFKPVASGGDGDDVQFWYVGYDPSLNTIIVGHQGTDTTKILPIITDLDFFLENLDSSLFPGIGSNIEVHSGFKKAQADYGMPRVGNQAFANYVDAHVSVSHVNNNSRKDPVPILPGRFLGFHHPSGEKHITDSNAWVACPGQDNDNSQCTVGEVRNILVGDTDDHSGPYDGIVIGC